MVTYINIKNHENYANYASSTWNERSTFMPWYSGVMLSVLTFCIDG